MQNQALKGAALVVLAMTLYIQNDVATKLLTERFDTLQVMMVRGVIGAASLLVLLRFTGTTYSWKHALMPAVMIRSACDGLASLAFVFALAEMPLATLTAIMMLAPVISAGTGALFFRERLTGRLAISVMLGFTGVLIFARPVSTGVNLPMFLACSATLLLSARDLFTRHTSAHVPSGLVALLTTLSVPVFVAPIIAARGYLPMTPQDLILLAYAGVFAAAGTWIFVQATRIATLAEIAPFRYSAVPLSLVAGFIVWGELPDLGMLVGSLFITIAGVIALASRSTPSHEG
ncbi:DMT family transporter [Sinorhizobium meliloti]|uniref:DMT family transporter n=1 Tax=Rhizobium meliloti TaxID=382 RepID=UPI000FD9040D|nr:DMT family transporter [Sinorhizobium meliloti]RVE85145.1 DMT family transporter [Sinorhizobium meliloti]RVH24973.1 DMT family transporter [Sinorhizobium meliloti]